MGLEDSRTVVQEDWRTGGQEDRRTGRIGAVTVSNESSSGMIEL